MLSTTTYGKRNGKAPLVIAHGLFGAGRNWRAIAHRLARARQVLTVDMRNHGESFRAASQNYSDMGADLAEVIAATGTKADVIGHSMGGKAAMVLALEHPGCVNRLVVADIAPVAYNHTQMPLIEAMRSVDLDAVHARGEADAMMRGTVPEEALRAFLLHSLDFSGARPRWQLNLDALAANMAAIIGFPDIAASFPGPTLFLSGGASDYVRVEHRARIKALFPAAHFAGIPGAGHWLHAEKPREFIAAIEALLG